MVNDLTSIGDQCPMNFDDGSNPWRVSDYMVQILDVGSASAMFSMVSFVFSASLCLISLYYLV